MEHVKNTWKCNAIGKDMHEVKKLVKVLVAKSYHNRIKENKVFTILWDTMNSWEDNSN